MEKFPTFNDVYEKVLLISTILAMVGTVL